MGMTNRENGPPSIELHIEELVLDGFEPADQRHIAEALQGELTRLFTERGPLTSMASGFEAARLDGGAFTAKPGLGAEEAGVQIATTIHRCLDR